MYDGIVTSSPCISHTVPASKSDSIVPPQKRQRQSIPSRDFSSSELGKLAATAASKLAVLGWDRYFKTAQQPLCLNDGFSKWHHRATPLLRQILHNGAPVVNSGPPWSMKQKLAAIQRGSHPSAKLLYRDFLHSEMAEMVRRGYWTVVPFNAIRHLPQLKISPAGVVPQRNRRHRTIIDHTFSGVNQATLPIAPFEAMQFGRTLQRLLETIVYADPSFGPVHMAKVDISDGYYRVPLTSRGALNLAVCLPSSRTNPLVAVPLTLTMGWVQSPPYFCAATETAIDHANSLLGLPDLGGLREHHQEASAARLDVTAFHRRLAPIVPAFHVARKPVGCADLYVDDGLALAQTQRMATATRRAVLHSFNGVFRANNASDWNRSPPRKEPISQKKIDEGDASWATSAILLGWLLDTVARTIRLPEHRQLRLHTVITEALQCDTVPIRLWHKLLGELRSMEKAVPGGKGLFSVLQVALQQATSTKVVLTAPVRACLQEWNLLAASLASRPTSLEELVPTPPQFVGSCDASKLGMGGVWLPTSLYPSATPYVWRAPFPLPVQHSLVSNSNPAGTINNSELELAGAIAHDAVIACHVPYRPLSTLAGTDNTPALSWLQRGAITTTGPTAAMLHLHARLRRAQRFRSTFCSVPGIDNSLADFASRSFHLSDDDFLAAFSARFPSQPTWQLLHLPTALSSKLTSVLQRQTQPEVLLLPEHDPLVTFGKSGPPTALTSVPTPSCWPTMIPSHFYKSTPYATALEHYLPAAVRSRNDRWKKPFVPLGRRSPDWVFPTRGSPPLVGAN